MERTVRAAAHLVTRQSPVKHTYPTHVEVMQAAKAFDVTPDRDGYLSAWALTKWYVHQFCTMNNLVK